jgi:hypothetical protein
MTASYSERRSRESNIALRKGRELLAGEETAGVVDEEGVDLLVGDAAVA